MRLEYDKFTVNDTDAAFKYWEVYDRTTNQKLDDNIWSYEKCAGTVTIKEAVPFHMWI